ncbi:MAG: tetratricopeptide repeat protein [Anaerolineales bacterium]|nr:tetratricopeptide repeat protein [Anaerolineales bacterium]
MAGIWNSYVPYHVAQELLAAPGQSPVSHHRRSQAVVLFADVSGFTALSETLGASGRSGTEELTNILNAYFEPMIALIQSYGGIIGKFGGDAMTVLFPYQEDEASLVARRAIQCALHMQERMSDYTAIPTRAGAFSLTMKAGLAIGPLFCTTIGDPSQRLEYIIAGSALDRCAEAEHHARAGEVVVQDELLQAARPLQSSPATPGYSLVLGLDGDVPSHPLPDLALFPPAAETVAAAYIHPSVAQRLREGQISFINEHRKVTVLFVNFENYDYDYDEQVGEKLQSYLLQVIQAVARYDGYLNKVDMGDKGSKCVILFGAPIAHEDDAERALHCALEIQQIPDRRVRTGVNTGFVYCGQVGSEARREYTVMGDAVNLSARLMQAAALGQILVSQATQREVAQCFQWGEVQSIDVKGKVQAVTAYTLVDIQRGGWLRLQEPQYALPMIGRQAEMQTIARQLELALARQGRIVGITAEAGMGKSRIAAEVIRQALQRGFLGFGGECLSHGVNTPYLVWRNLLGGLYGLEPAAPLEAQQRQLETRLAAINPAFSARLPLLSAALNLPIPENELTASLEAQVRKSSLEDLVVACIRHYSQSNPLLLVLEDCHWIDPLSNDLLEVVGRAVVDVPVLLLVIYRPPEANRERPAVTRFAHFSEIRLADFTPAEAANLIALKLEKLFGAAQEVPPTFVERITQRAQGNPFFIDEMINLIRDQGIDPADRQALESLDLPDSLHSLIISRIDQLEEAPKTTLKVASVIGRSFRASWLWGVYPRLGTPEQVQQHLGQLSRLDITPLDKPEPELEYLFKHIVTRQVAYESLALATRTMLHGEVGLFLERTYAADLNRYLDLLAHHYGLSENQPKQREYFRKAGQAAQSAYANQAAIEYYQRLLPIVSGIDQIENMLLLGEVWQLTGLWSEAQNIYQQALNAALDTGDPKSLADCQYALGRLARQEGNFAEAAARLEQARQGFTALQDAHGMGEATREIGIVQWSQGNLEGALSCFHQCLQLASQVKDQRSTFRALGNIGLVHKVQGDYQKALEYYQQCKQIAEEIGDRLGLSTAVGNMGNIYLEQGNYLMALESYTQNLHLALELGYQFGISVAIGNLGMIYAHQGDYHPALLCYTYNLRLGLELGDRPGVAEALWNLGETHKALGSLETSRQLFSQAVEMGRALDTPYELSDYLNSLAELQTQLGETESALQVTQEALGLATEFENQSVELKARLRQIRLETALGSLSPAQAVGKLDTLLEGDLSQAERAAVHHEAWRLDASQEHHRQLAAEAYASLYQSDPDVDFHRRYQRLTGETLPDPPPLPPLPEVVTRTPIDLEKLLTQVRPLIAEIEAQS